ENFMANAQELIKKYLPNVNIIQLATSVNNQPWLCAVHFYSDANLNLYWLSTLERQHSQQLKQNPRTAAYFLVHENTPAEGYVIGILATGTVQLVGENIDEQIGQGYVKKLNKDLNLLTDIRSGKNP